MSIIRENITPRGDGNLEQASSNNLPVLVIRENITPRGDGNLLLINSIVSNTEYKREYNSERRRKRAPSFKPPWSFLRHI